jgi:hypothetical protein
MASSVVAQLNVNHVRRFMLAMSSLVRLALAAAVLVLGSCGGPNGCNEFAAPESRRQSSCPTKSLADEPPKSTKYCYQSLGQVDCYDEPQVGRQLYIGPAPQY